MPNCCTNAKRLCIFSFSHKFFKICVLFFCYLKHDKKFMKKFNARSCRLFLKSCITAFTVARSQSGSLVFSVPGCFGIPVRWSRCQQFQSDDPVIFGHGLMFVSHFQSLVRVLFLQVQSPRVLVITKIIFLCRIKCY